MDVLTIILTGRKREEMRWKKGAPPVAMCSSTIYPIWLTISNKSRVEHNVRNFVKVYLYLLILLTASTTTTFSSINPHLYAITLTPNYALSDTK